MALLDQTREALDRAGAILAPESSPGNQAVQLATAICHEVAELRRILDDHLGGIVSLMASMPPK